MALGSQVMDYFSDFRHYENHDAKKADEGYTADNYRVNHGPFDLFMDTGIFFNLGSQPL